METIITTKRSRDIIVQISARESSSRFRQRVNWSRRSLAWVNHAAYKQVQIIEDDDNLDYNSLTCLM